MFCLWNPPGYLFAVGSLWARPQCLHFVILQVALRLPVLWNHGPAISVYNRENALKGANFILSHCDFVKLQKIIFYGGEVGFRGNNSNDSKRQWKYLINHNFAHDLLITGVQCISLRKFSFSVCIIPMTRIYPNLFKMVWVWVVLGSWSTSWFSKI